MIRTPTRAPAFKTLALATTYLALTLAPALLTPARAETEQQKQAEALADAQEAAKRAEAAKEDAAKAPPPAIPGAISSSTPAPPLKSAAEMSPNDALFDSINRGDAGGARDAMNRGAQLDAHNVLGQTPLDAAIEANRNDITFMLLSLRGSTLGAVLRPKATLASASAGHHATKKVVAHLAPRPADPGTPNPAVGFNGF
jgi:hypothetical protein